MNQPADRTPTEDEDVRSPIRIASVPNDHPYVAHLATPDADDGVHRLPDPPVMGADGSVRWWPPRMLDAGWLHEHRDDFDVLHVHFGFESFSGTHLADVVQALRDLGKPLVVTVHDLRNPHLADERAQLEGLDVLVPAAAAVMTLTRGAAAAIRERWEVDAVVVAHPHIVPLERLDEPAPRPAGARRRIGLHLKSLRMNVDALGALRGLARVSERRRLAGHPVDTIVTMHRAVADPTDRGHDDAVVTLARRLDASGVIDLVLHDPMDDDELFAHVASLDVSVMANVWGTHSGWIEMCYDLGVPVVAPHIGFYAEQHDPITFALTDDPQGTGRERIAPNRLADAIERALELPRPARATRTERLAERRGVARTHAALYRRAVAHSV